MTQGIEQSFITRPRAMTKELSVATDRGFCFSACTERRCTLRLNVDGSWTRRLLEVQ